ncbi:MAG: pilin [Candidatus Peribacteraceae bacterium]|nr:pilin [Candidatus Peribacteraceae bacterium]
MRLHETLLSGILIVAAFATPVSVLSQNTLPQRNEGGIDLLAPLGGQTNIPVTSGFGTFLAYFNDAAAWLIYVAMGLCVLWVLIGGFMVMLSAVDSSKREKGKSHMMWAITGIIILLFAGFILRTLNSMFFK